MEQSRLPSRTTASAFCTGRYRGSRVRTHQHLHPVGVGYPHVHYPHIKHQEQIIVLTRAGQVRSAIPHGCARRWGCCEPLPLEGNRRPPDSSQP